MPTVATEIPFGPYLLQERLGRGGMGETWRAAQRGATRSVAIKRILRSLSDQPKFVAAFINEAKVSMQLSHPNIAQVFELGQISGEHFMAMELVEGRSLLEVLERGAERGVPRLPPAFAVYVVGEALKGLHHAHTRIDEQGDPLQIVHRDVSPENVLISWDGEVKLVDFGIAKARIEGREETAVGTVKGKPDYFSPEQARGEQADAQSDVWGAGVVLYRALSGHVPVELKGRKQLDAIAHGRLTPLAERVPGLDPGLLAVVDRALSVERSQRFPTARAFQEALAPVLQRLLPGSPRAFAASTMQQIEAAAPVPAPARSRPSLARAWLAIPLLALLAAILYVLTAGYRE